MPGFKKRHITLLLTTLLILSGCVVFVVRLWKENQQQKQEKKKLEVQLQQATEAQKEATITRRISSQLEEIAYQQKEISDIQKQEAVHQTQIADQMRSHAEMEREKALNAQQAAIEAYQQMEEQKSLAETRKEEAIRAQMKADTLARLALGRSLGSQAMTQYTAGNQELARLLSYASWKFTSENKGDVYQPAIFDALSTTSNLSKRWGRHKGAIRDIEYFSDGNKQFLLSASQYGEIFLWVIPQDNISKQEVVYNNVNYDFRKIQINGQNNDIYVLSYTGELLVLSTSRKQLEIPLLVEEPMGMELLKDQLYVASKTGDIQVASINDWKFHTLYKHQAPITAFNHTSDGLMFGDNQGRVYQIKTDGKVTILWDKIKQPVTSIQSNLQTGIQAVGYKNGTVIAGDFQKGVYNELIGHISSVTQIQFLNGKLITGSYDGSVRLWNIDNENKIVSSIVYQSSEWIHALAVDRSGQRIFVGDEKGNLSLAPISPEQMAEQIKRKLTRNFTQEEWQYYIGELTKYESYK